jgi:hypothetical protein
MHAKNFAASKAYIPHQLRAGYHLWLRLLNV